MSQQQQFERDLRSAFNEHQLEKLGIPEIDADTGTESVRWLCVLARDYGHERPLPEDSAYTGERARIASAIVFVKDLTAPLLRGDFVLLFGKEWQIRSVRNLGMGEGQAQKLHMACEERTRGASGGMR